MHHDQTIESTTQFTPIHNYPINLHIKLQPQAHVQVRECRAGPGRPDLHLSSITDYLLSIRTYRTATGSAIENAPPLGSAGELKCRIVVSRTHRRTHAQT
jgi:hypothetical protein